MIPEIHLLEKFDSFAIDVGEIDVNIVAGDEYSLAIKSNLETHKVAIKNADDMLEVTDISKDTGGDISSKLAKFLGEDAETEKSDDYTNITLTVPTAKTFDEVKINIKSGNLNMDKIHSDDIRLDVKSGEINSKSPYNN
ncbi:MAG: hypothetical protein ATN35_02830 [Epulopiscium sp. Nele67-Bin004]|nr:MAG: hypothetical protein ATN35_02830 [Epulopiscium sp. Nele67-Bin004]